MLDLNNIYNMDCLQAMKHFPDNYFDLAIVDPPYGIKESAHRAKSRTKLAKTRLYRKEFWDFDIPPQEYFNELFRVSKNQIIWGINYYVAKRDLDIGPGRIVWDKVNGGTNFSDCELAYSSFHHSTRQFEFMWSGMLQGKSMKEGRTMQPIKANNEKRIHPTQKPVVLYDWLLQKYAKEGDKILDTHLGSASSVIACIKSGFDFIGFELDKHYYDAAVKRINENQKQGDAFRQPVFVGEIITQSQNNYEIKKEDLEDMNGEYYCPECDDYREAGRVASDELCYECFNELEYHYEDGTVEHCDGTISN